MPARVQFRWKTFAWIVAVLGIAFASIQFIRPALPNAPATADLQAPAEVKQILRTSCYNCHSNHTVLSWFDQPVPAYWLVVRDVREGRKHLNFSEIGTLPAAQQQGILFEAVSQVELGAMPLPAYTRVHPESVITREQLAVLRNYLTPPPQPAATAAEISTADAQYDQWIQSGNVTPSVAPAPNGIA
ncbi:MAG: heme-binding domain-containing protein, partial [Candidatus Sulfotelmatobacter sp.]